jgi:hypothetical protein
MGLKLFAQKIFITVRGSSTIQAVFHHAKKADLKTFFFFHKVSVDLFKQ